MYDLGTDNVGSSLLKKLNQHALGAPTTINRPAPLTDAVACAGAFHVALELSPHGTGETTYEFSYGWHDEDMTGVFSGLPKACDMHTYRESVELGHTWVSRAHVDKVIAKSEESWHAWDYHMLTNNCGTPTPARAGCAPYPHSDVCGAAGSQLRQHAEPRDWRRRDPALVRAGGAGWRRDGPDAGRRRR